MFVSIHLNSYPSSSVKGAQVFSQNNSQSKGLAKTIKDKLNLLIDKDKKVKDGDYYILNKTSRTGVLIECGFLSNQEERELLVLESYQQKIARRIVEGIVDYFKI